MASKKTTSSKPYVLVTTAQKGVFVGFLASRKGDEVRLEESRMVVYWSADAKGVVGMTQNGPGKQGKVTHAAPWADIGHVTSVQGITPEAQAKFEAGPWA
jgi:hypothetical protein